MKTFLVPDLGEGLEEVTVTRWDVAAGDQVELNQALCSVETAKAEVEIPSPYAGRVVELGGAQGDVLAVGAPLVRIDTGPATPDGDTTTRNPVLVGYGADDSFDAGRRNNTGGGRPKAKPAARKLAAELGVDLAGVPPGPRGVITAEAVLAVSDSAGAGYDLRPVSLVQATMAERITLSRSKIPDAHAS
ncbi:MAG: biotin/lipoyl-containing protein, partial [Mycobacterium sp.]